MSTTDFVDYDKEMDVPDDVDTVFEPEVVSSNGHYGTAGSREFVESPPLSLAEEMRRNPVLAHRNRIGLTERYNRRKKVKEAAQMAKEADKIAAYLQSLSAEEVAEYERALLDEPLDPPKPRRKKKGK
jgi:hypothetical protein